MRHGARGGLSKIDYFESILKRGELSGVGKRQQYLLG